jgi:hypothetical protein
LVAGAQQLFSSAVPHVNVPAPLQPNPARVVVALVARLTSLI